RRGARVRRPSMPPPERRPVNVRCTTWEQVSALYEHRICGDGLFVATMSPLAQGTPVPLIVRLPDDRTVEVDGHVAEVTAGTRPGMLLRFEAPAAALRAALDDAWGRVPVLAGAAPQSAAPVGPAAAPAGSERHAQTLEQLAAALEREPESFPLRAAFYRALAAQCRAEGLPREALLHDQTAEC